MASTSNKNTPSDYCLQQRAFELNEQYNTYINSQVGMAYKPGLPCGGSAPASHMSREQLSYNPVEIESALFGIGSTDLVKPQQPVCAKLKTLPATSFFPRERVVLPEPLVIEKNQRAFPIPE